MDTDTPALRSPGGELDELSDAPSKRPFLNATLRRYLTAFTLPRGILGAAVLLIMLVLALGAPLFFPGGFDQQTSNSFALPSVQHPFGTDDLGRDLLIRTVYGLRTDMSIIAVAVPLSMVLGTALGLLGALSAIAGTAAQRVLDIILGFPGVVLGICIVLIMGPGWSALVVSIAVSGLPFFGRQARAAFMEQEQREYVVAARALGVGKVTVLLRHILPNSVDPILVGGALYVVSAIFIEAGLSIIGLGIQPPEPSLGSLLNVGIRYIQQAPMYILGPTIVLILFSTAFSLLSDALNETVTRP